MRRETELDLNSLSMHLTASTEAEFKGRTPDWERICEQILDDPKARQAWRLTAYALLKGGVLPDED